MSCPICDQKAANCDCTATERAQHELLRDALAEIDRLREERRWRPATERLPEISEKEPRSRVLAAVEGGNVFELEYEMNVYAKTEKGRQPRWKWHGMICPWKVTHWQPLPPPPGDGEVEG